MRRALNVAFARACLEAMSAEDAAAAAGAFVSLLNAASPPERNDADEKDDDDDDDDDASVDPAVLECVRLLGARVSETPPPEVETRGAVLAEAWSIVARAAGKNASALSSFLRCAETWTDFALTHVRDEDVSNVVFFSRGEERCRVTTPLLRDVAAKVASFLRRPRPSGGAAPPTLDDDDQATIERVLTRATRRERDRGDWSFFESEPFEALVATLRDTARASFFRNALRTLLYDEQSSSGSRAERLRDGEVSMFPAAFLEDESARAFARRAAAAAHESLSLSRNASYYDSETAENVSVSAPPNETDRLLVRYVHANVCFLKRRSEKSSHYTAFRFLADARVAYADSEAARRATALSAAWLGASKGVSERFAAETTAFCRVTAMGVRDDEARVRLYLSAACAASLRGDEAATARASRLIRDAVADLANGNRFRADGAAGDASAAETAALCAAALATLGAASSETRDESSSESGGRVWKKSSRRTLGVLARFVDERRWKDGSTHRVAANLAVARAAAALARREPVARAAPFTRRRLFLLETAHACLQTAVDACETVDATLVASDARAAATMDVAECVMSSFFPTAEMRDLASALVSRAREDAVSGARDGRLAAVEKAVARFCDAEADAGDTLSG